MAREIKDLRAKPIKKESAKETKGAARVVPPPSSFEFNGVTYRKTDWDNEFTVRQDNIAIGIMKDVYSNYFNLFDANTAKLQAQINNAMNGKADINDAELQTLAIQQTIKSLNTDAMNRWEPKIIALFYIPESEKLFNADTFEAREQEFMDLPRSIRMKMKGLLDDFFYLKVPSIAQDFLFSIAAMNKTMEAAQT